MAVVRAELWNVYVGTYTGPKSEGIHGFRFNAGDGVIESRGLAAASTNPSFLAVHPGGRHLYSANEAPQWNGQPGGFLSAFVIEPRDGSLREINQQSAVGAGPCFVAVDATGRNLLAANYGGGSVVCLPIGDDGSLQPHTSFVQHTGSSVNPRRQEAPHAHSIYLSPDNRFAVAADLGLDQVLVYRFDAARGILAPNDPPFARLAPGSGPRHMAFAPSGNRLFVINELLSTLTSMDYDPVRGRFADPHRDDPSRGEVPGNSTAQVCVHPNGRFVYGSNRGDDSIVVMQVARDGRMTFVERVSTGGRTPRNFQLDPSGRTLWAANQNSDSIVIFAWTRTRAASRPRGRRCP